MTVQTTPSGIVFVDKPAGFTSHDVVAKLRRLLGTRKVGHAGTLDPMATGLLTIGVGSSTRLLTHMVGLSKTYTATIRLGIATISDDRDGEVTSVADPATINDVSDQDILRAVETLTGEIDQVPSSVSAKKVDGKRAYALVREGKTVELKAKRVTIHSFEVHQINRHTTDEQISVIDVDVTVDCSSGTYIRALARDLASALGTSANPAGVGGHLIALRRVAVGPFSLEDDGEQQKDFCVMSQDYLISASTAKGNSAALETAAPETQMPQTPEAKSFTAPPSVVARKLFDAIELDEMQSIHLRQGKRFALDASDTDLSAAFDPTGGLIGLVSVKDSEIKVITNFPVDEEA